MVAANPEVRLRVEQSIYELNIAPVLDPVEFDRVFAALGEKYPFWREQIELDGRGPRFALLKLRPRQ